MRGSSVSTALSYSWPATHSEARTMRMCLVGHSRFSCLYISNCSEKREATKILRVKAHGRSSSRQAEWMRTGDKAVPSTNTDQNFITGACLLSVIIAQTQVTTRELGRVSINLAQTLLWPWLATSLARRVVADGAQSPLWHRLRRQEHDLGASLECGGSTYARRDEERPFLLVAR